MVWSSLDKLRPRVFNNVERSNDCRSIRGLIRKCIEVITSGVLL